MSVLGVLGLIVCLTIMALAVPAAAADPTTPPAVSGRDMSSVQAVLPADVLARTVLLRAELDLVRRELGARNIQRPEFPVEGAAPREVYFQAHTLFVKSDRFCFEQVGVVGEPPVKPAVDTIRPYHVFRLVDRALVRILLIKRELGITDVVKEQVQVTSTSPTDVYRSIVGADQQLNELLSQRTDSADVYEKVTEGVHLAAALLAHFPGTRRIPDPPALVRRKVPGDSFQRLLAVFAILQAIAEKSGLKMLRIDADSYSVDASSSDVYDMATLIVSELSYLHSKMPGASPPAPAYYPGRRTPSHVFQRIGILEAQLVSLRDRVAAEPNWLQ